VQRLGRPSSDHQTAVRSACERHDGALDLTGVAANIDWVDLLGDMKNPNIIS
jgi:hypothetical protein